ncbi:hypothetical protein BDP81DRAFT_392202 [Colletotrichum phormii]|uniref:Uncharacterized protein n=1 Tax=Colletotrichum phormii TaxID=359342 RepID=A0AAI9ZV44_9PEZI|nr:uncharacterized protein BDP81DRAFT_392202 [Colletotrichum phormii]KAK1638772.1 hypothetical protein BDP81DRAFT_392202 [Colletotrichum phormii]
MPGSDLSAITMIYHKFNLLALPLLALASGPAAHTIGQLSDGTWLENIAIRPNGNLLVTQSYPEVNLYIISHPSKNRSRLEKLVHLPTVQSLHGIAQVSVSSGQETYIVIGGNQTGLSDPIKGEFSAWGVSFDRTPHGEHVKARKISEMSEQSVFLNGVASAAYQSIKPSLGDGLV